MLTTRKMQLAFIVTILYVVNEVFAQDCSRAPTSAMKIICEQLAKMDKSARAHHAKQSKVPSAKGSGLQPELQAEPNSPPSCMDMGCLCPFIGGGSCNRVVRKEYRRLSSGERRKFHDAMNQLKQSGVFAQIATIHSQLAMTSGAHAGPAFLPWHREYIKRLEIALRQVDPDVALPYWDSTLDQNLPDARDSVLWSSDFLGDSDSGGNVVNGPFANWRTVEGRDNIFRQTGGQASLFTENELNTVLQQGSVDRILSSTTPGVDCPYPTDFGALEFVHGNIHIWVGGDMVVQATSANDPAFFLHHSFVDLIWEQWRESRQNRAQREQEYPMDSIACSSQLHFRDAPMLPFEGYRNIDGLSNKYTDQLYQYETRPTCSNNCGSPFLFCDRSHGQPRCVSKVKIGGRCDGFEREDICYQGVCANGRCVPGATPAPVARRPPSRPTARPPQPTSSSECYNEHPCCDRWAWMGRCEADVDYMQSNCQASCRMCQVTFDPTIECSDHHPSCLAWSARGECENNPLWMAENCRMSCMLCGQPRHCRGGGGGHRRFRDRGFPPWG